MFFCNRTFDNKLKECYPTTPNRQRLVTFSPVRFGLSALSLAATRAISVDFFSSGYLDVSVPRVVFVYPI